MVPIIYIIIIIIIIIILLMLKNQSTTRNSLNTNGFTDGIFSVGILRSKLPTATFRP